MRISDWSSDVCSSDLSTSSRCCSTTARSSSTGRTSCWQRPSGRSDRPADSRETLAGAASAASFSSQASKSSPLKQLLQEFAGGVAAQRIASSEEPTAELQYLVRISYAVACLKNT